MTAKQLTTENVINLAVWAQAIIVDEIDPFDGDKRFPGLNVQCGDTVKRASLGDYVIKHEDGTFDVKKPLEFTHGQTIP